MWKSLKNYIAAFGKWGLLMAAILVGDVLGIIQSYYTEWLIPTWGWWLILVIILVVSPFLAFHKLRVQRDELRVELQKDKDTPKLPHPELRIYYLKHEFGVAGEGKYTGLSVDNGTPILSIEAEFSPTGPMRIEAVKLHFVGRDMPSLNWKVQEYSDLCWGSPSNAFDVSEISPGKHDTELWALVKETWWGPYLFTIVFPEVNS